MKKGSAQIKIKMKYISPLFCKHNWEGYIIIICLVMATHTNPLAASANFSNVENSLSYNEMQRLNQRLEEIKLMDIKKMNPAEKNNLRAEVRSIRKKYLSAGPVLFISAGTLILIVILLIILL